MGRETWGHTIREVRVLSPVESALSYFEYGEGREGYKPGDLIPAVQAYISGEEILYGPNYSSEKVVSSLMGSSPSMKKLSLSLARYPSSEAEEAVRMIHDDFTLKTGDAKDVLAQERGREWYVKSLSGDIIIRMMESLEASGIPVVNNANSLNGAIENYSKRFIKTLGRVDSSSLSEFLVLEDLFQLHESTKKKKGEKQMSKNTALLHRTGRRDLIMQFEEDNETIMQIVENATAPFREAMLKAKGRLLDRWGSDEVADAISVLPKLKSETFWDVLSAIEVSLSDSEFRNNMVSGSLDNVSVGGVLEMLSSTWGKENAQIQADSLSNLNVGLKKRFLSDVLNKKLVTRVGTSVPMIELPSTAIHFLDVVLKHAIDEKQVEDLSKIDREVKKAQRDQWLLALVGLRTQNAESHLAINKIISESKLFDSKVKNVLLDQAPGQLWLSGGRVHTSVSGRIPQDAYILHRSSFIADVPKVIEELSREEVTIPDEKVEPMSVFVNEDMKGELLQTSYIVSPSETMGVIDRITTEKVEGTQEAWDTLANDFVTLSNSEAFVEAYGRSVVFDDRLFSSPLMEKAKGLGINGFIQNGVLVELLLDPSVVQAKVDKKPAVASLIGEVNERGEVSFSGTNESFLLTEEHLLLNNLVLEFMQVKIKDLQVEDPDSIKNYTRLFESVSEICKFSNIQANGLPELSQYIHNGPAVAVWLEDFNSAATLRVKQ